MLLHAEIQGQGEPIVMLHGIFGSNSNLGAISRLLESQFQLFRLDLRNHGLSPHAESMSFADMAEDLLEFLDAKGLKKSHVFGHSLGGKVCMEFAFQHPDRVKKLIVGDVAPINYPGYHNVILDGLQAIDLKTVSRRSEADEQLSAFVEEKGVRQFLLKNLVRDDSGEFEWLLNLPVVAAGYDQLSGAVGDGKIYAGDALFIRGGASNYIRERDYSAILQKFPKAKIKTIDGAGHWLQAEQPELFAQLMTDFLQG